MHSMSLTLEPQKKKIKVNHKSTKLKESTGS